MDDRDAGIKVTPFEEFEAAGAAAEVDATPPAVEDLATIMYTSGTTGNPKGVMLAHGAIVTMNKSVLSSLSRNNLDCTSSARTISFLPLAHILDRVQEEMVLGVGGCIGYWQGSLPLLLDDIKTLKPTLFVAVPRVFDRIYQRAQDQNASGSYFKSLLFQWAFSSKLARLNAGFPSATAAPFWDRLVFSKVKEALGGHVEFIVSAGAPLAPHVEEFLKVTMCAPVMQAYGLTETCGASFVTTPDCIEQAGCVGEPEPVTSFCLESVPEMQYDALATPPRGEVLIKSDGNFHGYYNAADKTAEVLEACGWFHSGDIAELLPGGYIKIIDRKKNIFKLSQGEYVAVEQLEGEYKKCSIVNQIWVYGNSFESCLVCVVVPNKETLMEWAKGSSIKSDDFEKVCASPEANAHVISLLQAQGTLSKLRGFELVRAVHLDAVEFTVDNDLVTPTFNLRRPQLFAWYKEQMNAAYENLKVV